jgi:hypothetical protein
MTRPSPKRRAFKLWVWDDPAYELRRYGHVIAYGKKPTPLAFKPMRATLTLEPPRKEKGKR